jgi:hypothetical protein
MALTVYQQPESLTPAYNDQIFTAKSNQIAIADFKYIVSVVVNGDTNTYTEDILQRPDGYLVFNAKEWVQNYIEHYFEFDNINLASPINLATGKRVRAQVKIYEYYTAAIQSTTTINYDAFDACLTDAAFNAYDPSDYVFNGTTGLYFLSKDETTITPDDRIALNQPFFIHFINTTATPITNISIRLFRGITLIQTINIASLPTPVTVNDIYQLYLGSNIFTSPQVNDTVIVKFKNGGTDLLEYEFNYQDICTKYQDYVIYYLDRDGNILSFHFEQKSKKNFSKKVNTVTLNKNVLNTTTGAYGSTSYDREDHVISTAIESTIDLNTTWLTQLQITQLKDLFDSPIVYVWDYNSLRSCRVTNNSFEEYQLNNESLIQLAITIDLGITETRQRGI